MKIPGKVAIVFGGARGQGRAHCEALLDKGAQVCCADVLPEVGSTTEKELTAKYGQDKVFFLRCDVTKEPDIDKVFRKTQEKFGPVEIVISTVGVMQEFDWQLCIDVNLGGTIRCVEACLKFMAKDKGGKGGIFVTTSSISGLKPEDGRPVYSATKYAQNAYIRSWALEKNFSKHGIRMNSICTTRVKTEFLSQVSADRIRFTDELAHNKEEGNELSPEYVAEVGFIKLVEDENLNGAVMRISILQGVEIVEFEKQPDY